MTVSNTATPVSSKLKSRLGLSAAAIAILAVLACELPMVLTLFGMAGLGAMFPGFSIRPTTALVSGIVGLFLLLLLAGLLRRRNARKASS